MESTNVGVTSLYDINKKGYSLVPPIEEDKLYEKLKEIGKWFWDKQYVLLLCRERADYTFFRFKDGTPGFMQAATNDLRECINGRGKCLDIIYEDDRDAYEIWMRIDGEVYMFLMFDCFDFVIEV